MAVFSRNLINATLAIGFCVLPTFAAADAALARLFDALKLGEYVEIVRVEGLNDIDEVSQDMLGRPASGNFVQQMTAVYDLERMKEQVRSELAQLDSVQIEQALLFFESDMGARIADVELSARRAISDPDIEDAAREAWGVAQSDDDSADLREQIEALQVTSDLVNSNVSGALNSNLRFYQGMAEGGGLELGEDQILQLVWAQEPEIREDTQDWLGAYMLMAYAPLDLEDLKTYNAMLQTKTGQALNAAIFAGFNGMFDEISFATGQIIAFNMASQDL